MGGGMGVGVNVRGRAIWNIVYVVTPPTKSSVVVASTAASLVVTFTVGESFVGFLV